MGQALKGFYRDEWNRTKNSTSKETREYYESNHLDNVDGMIKRMTRKKQFNQFRIQVYQTDGN